MTSVGISKGRQSPYAPRNVWISEPTIRRGRLWDEYVADVTVHWEQPEQPLADPNDPASGVERYSVYEVEPGEPCIHDRRRKLRVSVPRTTSARLTDICLSPKYGASLRLVVAAQWWNGYEQESTEVRLTIPPYHPPVRIPASILTAARVVRDAARDLDTNEPEDRELEAALAPYDEEAT